MSLSEEGLYERIEKNEEIVFLNFWKWNINANKAHALQYGVHSAFIFAMFSFYVSFQVAATLMMGLMLMSFGISAKQMESVLSSLRVGENTSIFILTIEHKPHYYWTTFIPSYIITIIVLKYIAEIGI